MSASRRGRHVRRAGLSSAQLEMLADMAADAIDTRLARLGQWCRACDSGRDLLCNEHAADVRQVGCYRALVARLGVEVK